MIRRIEVEFAIPVELEDIDCRDICEIIERIARRNQPEGYVHWQSGSGQKALLSKADSRFLGKEVREDAPETGEPEWDDSVFHVETCFRERYESEKPETEVGK